MALLFSSMRTSSGLAADAGLSSLAEGWDEPGNSIDFNILPTTYLHNLLPTQHSKFRTYPCGTWNRIYSVAGYERFVYSNFTGLTATALTGV